MVGRVIGSHAQAPRKQLRALFAATVDRAVAADFRGCPFGNTLVEFPEESHPARAVIVRFKDSATHACANWRRRPTRAIRNGSRIN